MAFKLTSQLEPINKLFHTVPNTDLSELFNEGIKIAERIPKILKLIDGDLDKMALEKKLERMEDDLWYKSKTYVFPELTMSMMKTGEIKSCCCLVDQGCQPC